MPEYSLFDKIDCTIWPCDVTENHTIDDGDSVTKLLFFTQSHICVESFTQICIEDSQAIVKFRSLIFSLYACPKMPIKMLRFLPNPSSIQDSDELGPQWVCRRFDRKLRRIGEVTRNMWPGSIATSNTINCQQANVNLWWQLMVIIQYLPS